MTRAHHKLPALAVALVFVTSACGEDEPERLSEAEWRAAAEDHMGHAFASDSHWEDYKEVWTDMCEDKSDPDDWSYFLAIAADEGTNLSDIEAQAELACPEDADDVRDAIEDLQDVTSEMDDICALDPTLRTEEQQRMAEAVGC